MSLADDPPEATQTRRFLGRGRHLRRLLLFLLATAIAYSGTSAATPSPDFQAWLSDLRTEALARGTSAATLDTALSDIVPIPRVIELDRRQPEFTLSFDEYLTRVVSERRVRLGRRLLAENGRLLDAIAEQYRVQPRFIVALWGIETDFGRLTGGYPVVDSLATLAFDGRRSTFFRQELLIALQILDEGHIGVDDMKGSWAGAMGQVQFMPSSFQRFAVDYDGDGRRDIWSSRADALASAANYLANSGWRSDQTWGRPVRLPRDFDHALVGRDAVRPLSEWQALGVHRADGRRLPRSELSASLIQPGGPGGPTFLVYDNYRTLLKWNRSDYFATAVGTLADRIRA